MTTTKARATKATTTTKTDTTHGPPTCACGCGEPGTGRYRPGHDARHASAVGALIAANRATAEDLEPLSVALLAKAQRVADRLTAQAAARSEREHAKANKHSRQAATPPRAELPTRTPTRKPRVAKTI